MSNNLHQQSLNKNQAISILWSKGILTFKLDAVQKELYECYKNSTGKVTVWSCSRRLGKSYALCCIALEKCLQTPNTIVKYIAPTQKHVRSIIKPLIAEILKDCPKPLRPTFKSAQCVYTFPNGSEIQLAGTDSGHAEGLRGGSAHLCVVDEAAFCTDLSYIIQSILIPTTTTTRGKIILSSTPPLSSDHDFETFRKIAFESNNYVLKTIYDGLGSRITMDIINEILAQYPGGEKNLDFRREYLCEMVTSERDAIVPEFQELESEIVKEWKRVAFADNYVSGDVGAKDFTVYLFAYYDFKAAKLIIEDEVVFRGEEKSFTTDDLAKAIKDKEKQIFINPMSKEFEKPYLRISDNNLILINDLHKLHGLIFVPTAKDDKEAALNNMRIMLKEKRIIINPRCKVLIYHLKNGTWKKGGKEYARTSEGGHYDAIDALVYLVRNINYTRNPYPENYDRQAGVPYFDSGEKRLTPVQKEIKSWFQPRFSLKVKKNHLFNK